MIPLYRSDPYLKSCETVIDRVLSRPEAQIVFCREALFMEGGGQPRDHGSLCIEGRDFPLLGLVKEKGNTGYAISSDATVVKGQSVRCDLDWERRYRTMRLHSAQHAFAGALRCVRQSILTGGMQIAEDAMSCTVLYPTDSALTDSDLAQGQLRLTQEISENRSILSDSVDSEADAIKKYAQLYRPTIASGSLKGKIRLILIDELDANACGGTHVRRLGEVGTVRLTSVREDERGKLVTIALE
jgi:Ser-tRNA(Ala) deacylase AlaX